MNQETKMMSSEKNTPVLVVAATSKVGALVVNELQKRGANIRTLVRSSAKAKEMLSEEVEIYDGFDYNNPETACTALSGVEKIYVGSSIDANWLQQTKAFLDVAKKTDVKHIVRLSVYGCSDTSKGFGAGQLGRDHWDVEQYIQSSGFLLTALRPMWFHQNINTQFGDGIRQRSTLNTPFGSDAKLNFIDVQELAEVAALALTALDHENQTYELTGPQSLSMTEMAEFLSRVTGRQIKFEDMTMEQFKKFMVEAWSLSPEHAEETLVYYQQGRLGNMSDITDTVEKVTGYKGGTFEQYVKDNLQEFLPPLVER